MSLRSVQWKAVHPARGRGRVKKHSACSARGVSGTCLFSLFVYEGGGDGTSGSQGLVGALGDIFAVEVHHGAGAAVQVHGLHTAVALEDLGALDDAVIAGVISIAYKDGRERLWIRNRALPMVCINTTGYHLDGIYQVCSDEQQGTELALEHFYSFGHRNLGILTFCSCLPGPPGNSMRVETFHRYLEKRGCTGTAVNMIDCNRAIDAVRKLLDSGVTAILAAGESVGLPVAHALNLFHRRIPEDVSLISMENRRISEYLTPPHTTIEQRMDLLADAALSLLEKQWNGEQNITDVAVNYCLRSRDSVAPPPGN